MNIGEKILIISLVTFIVSSFVTYKLTKKPKKGIFGSIEEAENEIAYWREISKLLVSLSPPFYQNSQEMLKMHNTLETMLRHTRATIGLDQSELSAWRMYQKERFPFWLELVQGREGLLQAKRKKLPEEHHAVFKNLILSIMEKSEGKVHYKDVGITDNDMEWTVKSSQSSDPQQASQEPITA